MSIIYTFDGLNNLTIYVSGHSYRLENDDERFREAVVDLVELAPEKYIEKYFQTKERFLNFTGNNIQVDNDKFTFKGIKISNYIIERILDMRKNGYPFMPMLKFLDKLLENPSKKIVDEIYLWGEKAKLPITSEGNIVAYKVVSDKYGSLHQGGIKPKNGEPLYDYAPGKVVEMPRNLVNENSAQTCSTGLHACSESYIPSYNSSSYNRVILVEIDPKDVVSIPSDYSMAKIRCCKMTVLEDVGSANDFRKINSLVY